MYILNEYQCNKLVDITHIMFVQVAIKCSFHDLGVGINKTQLYTHYNVFPVKLYILWETFNQDIVMVVCEPSATAEQTN